MQVLYPHTPTLHTSNFSPAARTHAASRRFSASVLKLSVLFPSQVFPHSPFSGGFDTEPESTTRSSPPLALSHDDDGADAPPAHKRSRGGGASSRAGVQPKAPIKRTRSLSASPAQERDLRRTGCTGPSTDAAGGAGADVVAGAVRRGFSREVNMSRVFREHARDSPAPAEAPGAAVRTEKKAKGEESGGGSEERGLSCGECTGGKGAYSQSAGCIRGVEELGDRGLGKG